jgi:DNA-binding winged helix-turn-helix (wHTH) protein/pimeloyl-ACP methyl ester carboxylesterase
MPLERKQVAYEFGPFRLELEEHRLLRRGRSVPLPGKAFHTLCILVERHGKLVAKEELLNAVWPETVVEENNLDRNISTLRKTLGEQADGASFIETVPRVGYRFVGQVTECTTTPAPAPLDRAVFARAGVAAPLPIDRDQESTHRQEIRFCTTRDKVRLAYATVGEGFPLVKVANCFNHLDFEWESPIWRHWIRDLVQGHSIVRYDGRGNGLSEWDVKDISFEAWIHDLETVVDAAGLRRFALMGISQGGAIAIAYAARHPERVSHLILGGAYSRGANHRGRPEVVEVRRALETLVQLNWGKVNPSFFQVVTNLYIPEKATAEEQDWFRELQIISVSPANLVRYMQACDDINVRPLLPALTVPAIVFHSDCDRVAPPEEGRIIATEIPRARFVPLPSANHLLLAAEPAWKIFRQELAAFLKEKGNIRANATGT